MAIEWNTRLSVNVEQIDEQHQELFRRINALLFACDAGRGKEELLAMLQFLDDYVTRHFRDEEKLQHEIGFPDLVRHREEHRRFVAELHDIKKKFALEGSTQRLVATTNRILVGWLIEHVSLMDREIGRFAGQKSG